MLCSSPTSSKLWSQGSTQEARLQGHYAINAQKDGQIDKWINDFPGGSPASVLFALISKFTEPRGMAHGICLQSSSVVTPLPFWGVCPLLRHTALLKQVADPPVYLGEHSHSRVWQYWAGHL